mmetsp:Transcript_5269/g.19178  ORF Transcript_5269/g.19178 Transcript_5269/m.19178 type:complete len:330 (+) Transcript_5269:1515-2504(+)
MGAFSLVSRSAIVPSSVVFLSFTAGHSRTAPSSTSSHSSSSPVAGRSPPPAFAMTTNWSTNDLSNSISKHSRAAARVLWISTTMACVSSRVARHWSRNICCFLSSFSSATRRAFAAFASGASSPSLSIANFRTIVSCLCACLNFVSHALSASTARCRNRSASPLGSSGSGTSLSTPTAYFKNASICSNVNCLNNTDLVNNSSIARTARSRVPANRLLVSVFISTSCAYLSALSSLRTIPFNALSLSSSISFVVRSHIALMIPSNVFAGFAIASINHHHPGAHFLLPSLATSAASVRFARVWRWMRWSSSTFSRPPRPRRRHPYRCRLPS